jgi:hypothetical protein
MNHFAYANGRWEMGEEIVLHREAHLNLAEMWNGEFSRGEVQKCRNE